MKVGETFPDLKSFKLEAVAPDIKGKVVLVDFWASWCGPCKQSFPTLDELQKKYGPQGFVIIAVSEDEKKSDMDDFLKEHPVSFTMVRDAGADGKKLVDKVEVSAMPSSFLIDATGKVAFCAHRLLRQQDKTAIHAGNRNTFEEVTMKTTLICFAFACGMLGDDRLPKRQTLAARHARRLHHAR